MATDSAVAEVSDPGSNERSAVLLEAVSRAAPYAAHELLRSEAEAVIALVLTRLNPAFADQILWEFSEEQRARVLDAGHPLRRGSSGCATMRFPRVRSDA